MHQTRIVSRLLALSAALAAVVVPAGVARAAVEGPFEPNDTMQTAFGPLVAGVGYAATIESPSNADWYYLYTAGPGTVDLTIALSSCGGAATTAASCSNLTARAYNGDGGMVGSTIVNTVGGEAHIAFDAPRRWRYSVSLQQGGIGGAAYALTANATGGLTSAPPDQPLPPPQAPPPANLPTVIPRFSARFETSYVGSAARPRLRKITGLTVQGLQTGSTVIVKCTKGCAKRYAKTVTARGPSRRLGGLPMALKRNTRFRIEVRLAGFVGRVKEYGFASKVPLPRVKTSGCTSPYDFAPIFCAPGTE